MNLWNVRELPLPPITTYKTKNTDIDIKYLHQICQEIKDFFDDNKYLHTEHFLLSRLIYRMKTKFRSAKDLKAVEKVNRAVDIFLNVNVSSSLSMFLSLIPSKYKSDTYLPSKNLLDYILVRLQGVTKLLERIVESCKISAHLLNERMHIGHFWKLAFLLFSLVSRIYVIATFTINRICEFYGKLLPFSSKLLNVGKEFLPDSYGLPVDLKEWINIDFTEFKQIQHIEEPSNIPDIIDFFDLIHDDSDVEFCDEYVLLEDTDDDKVELVDEHKERNVSSNHKSIQRSSLNGFRGFEKIEDVGEVIDLENSKQLVCAAESSNLSDSIIEQTVEVSKKSIGDSILSVSDESIIELTPLNRKKPRKSKKMRNLNYNKNFISRPDNTSDSIIAETVEVGKKSIDDSISLLSDESILELSPLNRKKHRKSKKIRNLTNNKDINSKPDNKSDPITEETVQVGKGSIDDSILLLSDESIIELSPLNRKKPRKSKEIRNLNYNKDNTVGKSYFMEDSWKDKSKCNKKNLVFKRKVELDSDSKIKRGKLSNPHEFRKPSGTIKVDCKGPLNRSELMKRNSNKNRIPCSHKMSNNPHHQLNLHLNSKLDSSSKSINENQSLERKEKCSETVMVKLNKSTKRKSSKTKITVNKKKHKNTNQLNLDIKNRKPRFSSKDMEAVNVRKTTRKKTEGISSSKFSK